MIFASLYQGWFKKPIAKKPKIVIIRSNNLTDENPPYFHSNFNGNTEPGVYDVIGRRVFVSIVSTF